MMPSKIIKRKIEMFAYFKRKSGSPGRTKQTLSAWNSIHLEQNCQATCHPVASELNKKERIRVFTFSRIK